METSRFHTASASGTAVSRNTTRAKQVLSANTAAHPGRCDPCDKGYEPSPDTYCASTAPATHRLAA